MDVVTHELEKALKALELALAAPKTDLTRDASIQRFEFTVELSWKTAKKIMGAQTQAPKGVIREMAQSAYIEDIDIWLKAIDMRNLSSRTYKEKLANEVYDFAVQFAPQVSLLLTKLRAKQES